MFNFFRKGESVFDQWFNTRDKIRKNELKISDLRCELKKEIDKETTKLFEKEIEKTLKTNEKLRKEALDLNEKLLTFFPEN